MEEGDVGIMEAQRTFPALSLTRVPFEVIFPYAWIAVCSIAGLMPLSTIVIFLTLPVAMGCSRTMMKSINGGSDIIADLDVRTANLQLLFSALLSVALIVDKFI